MDDWENNGPPLSSALANLVSNAFRLNGRLGVGDSVSMLIGNIETEIESQMPFGSMGDWERRSQRRRSRPKSGCLKYLSAQWAIGSMPPASPSASVLSQCLKCLSAQWAIGRRARHLGPLGGGGRGLKCLSAQWAIGRGADDPLRHRERLRSQMPFGSMGDWESSHLLRP